MGTSAFSSRVLVGLGFSLAASVGVFGATPIARVISADTVDVSGIAAPARNFAVVAVGDEVTTKGTPATLQFRDGTSITLHQNSRVRVEGPARQPTVRMVKGTASYNLAPASTLRIVNTRGESLNQILDNGLPTGMSRGNSLADPWSAGLVYRSPAGKQTGVAVPSGSIMVGQFTSNVIPGTGFNGPQIQLPSGIVINLTATTTTPPGGGVPVVTYTVASVSVPVTVTDTAANGTTTTTALPNTYATISSGTATGQSSAVTSADSAAPRRAGWRSDFDRHRIECCADSHYLNRDSVDRHPDPDRSERRRPSRRHERGEHRGCHAAHAPRGYHADVRAGGAIIAGPKRNVLQLQRQLAFAADRRCLGSAEEGHHETRPEVFCTRVHADARASLHRRGRIRADPEH